MLRSFGESPYYFCTGSVDSDQILEDNGLKSYGGLVGMYYDLGLDLPEVKTEIEYDIRPISNSQDYQIFSKVMTEAAGIDSSLGQQFFNSYEKYECSPFLGLIAYTNKEAIGCIMLLKTDMPIAGIYYLWVLPQYRNKGIGFALSTRCLEIARSIDYKQVVIQCMATSVNLHKRIGFVPVSQMGLYGR